MILAIFWTISIFKTPDERKNCIFRIDIISGLLLKSHSSNKICINTVFSTFIVWVYWYSMVLKVQDFYFIFSSATCFLLFSIKSCLFSISFLEVGYFSKYVLSKSLHNHVLSFNSRCNFHSIRVEKKKNKPCKPSLHELTANEKFGII